MKTTLKLNVTIAALVSGLAFTSVRAAELTHAETKTIAEEGFIYGLPIVMNYAVMYEYSVDKNSGQYKNPFNVITNEARVFTYEDTSVITPNSDTPYSILWLDLRAEPIVLSVPEVEKSRYFSVMMCDGNTYNYGYIGSRATKGEGGDYMVVGPDWKGETPAGIKKVFKSSTQFSAVAYRTQLFNAEDMPNVVKIQSGYKVNPLSTYLKQPAPPAAPVIDFPKANAQLVKTGFFDYLAFAMQLAPAEPHEKEIRAKLAKLGVEAGKKFDLAALSPEHQAALVAGVKEGEAKIAKYLESGQKNIHGWKVGSLFGDSAFYKGDWLKRAAAAQAGIYGNDAVEAMYPMTKTLADGELLDASKNNYTLTFAKGEFPPVNAFWSVTMYDGKSQLLIKNPINRYLINSPMLPQMKKNPDGGVTLYIQKDSPGADKKSNWLPAPDNPRLSRHAPLLAEDRGTFHPASGRRFLETAGHREGEVSSAPRPHLPFPAFSSDNSNQTNREHKIDSPIHPPPPQAHACPISRVARRRMLHHDQSAKHCARGHGSGKHEVRGLLRFGIRRHRHLELPGWTEEFYDQEPRCRGHWRSEHRGHRQGL